MVPTVQNRLVDIGQSVWAHCAGTTQGYLKWVSIRFYNAAVRSRLAIDYPLVGGFLLALFSEITHFVYPH